MRNIYVGNFNISIVDGYTTLLLNGEPGTERKIKVEFEPSETWVKVLFGDQEITNEYEYIEYVKNSDLRVPFQIELQVPGCVPSKQISIPITGTFEGGICDNKPSPCSLGLPTEAVTFTVTPPELNTVILPEFNVIRGSWSKPIKLRIERGLLIPEVLTVKPKSLLDDALIFNLRRDIETSIPIQFSFAKSYFPTILYVYIYAKDNLALSQRIEIETEQECPQCLYSVFYDKLRENHFVYVAEASKQSFVPLYVPTMKINNKYCFNYMLSKIPSQEISLVIEDCNNFNIEPTELIFSPNNDIPKQASFCITPKEVDTCQLNFFLAGDGTHEFIVPNSIQIRSTNTELKMINIPKIIKLTNRKISEPLKISYELDENEFLEVTLTPNLVENDFFTFDPTSFRLSHETRQNYIEFYITPNVDCPLITGEINEAFYVVNWNIDGELLNFADPTPMYIKVEEGIYIKIYKKYRNTFIYIFRSN